MNGQYNRMLHGAGVFAQPGINPGMYGMQMQQDPYGQMTQDVIGYTSPYDTNYVSQDGSFVTSQNSAPPPPPVYEPDGDKLRDLLQQLEDARRGAAGLPPRRRLG